MASKRESPIGSFASKRNLLLHPLTITSVLWGMLMIFYAFHFSNLLLFSTPELLPVTLAIWIPFGLVALGSFLWRPRALRRRYRLQLPGLAQLVTIEKRLRSLWYLWLVLAVFETLFSGGFRLFGASRIRRRLILTTDCHRCTASSTRSFWP